VVVRAIDPKDKDISKVTKDLTRDISQVTGTVQGKATQASQSIQEAASKLDLSQLVRYNFYSQVGARVFQAPVTAWQLSPGRRSPSPLTKPSAATRSLTD
jgi:hypothetical protein